MRPETLQELVTYELNLFIILLEKFCSLCEVPMLARNFLVDLGYAITKVVFKLLILWFFGLSVCSIVQARQRDEPRSSQLQEDISALRKDIRDIGEQQQRIIDQLDELRRLIPVNPVSQRALEQPSSPTALEIHGERFKGNQSASVVIVEYSDFECPYCRKYEGSYVNMAGPLSIVRSVSSNTNGTWKFTVTKPTNGVATINPLP
jgi:hypothetical protein